MTRDDGDDDAGPAPSAGSDDLSDAGAGGDGGSRDDRDADNFEVGDESAPEDSAAAADATAAEGGSADATDSDPVDADATDSDPVDADATDVGDSDGRDVVVPMRVYKSITVFTTLFAVFSVVGGFVLLDTATDRARAPLSEVDPILALVGIGLILSGAAVYAFSTRFRADGMGKSKDDTDGGKNNG
jgi:hypothetical protein